MAIIFGSDGSMTAAFPTGGNPGSVSYASLPPAANYPGYLAYATIDGIGRFQVESRQVGSAWAWRPMGPLTLIQITSDDGVVVGPIDPAVETTIKDGVTLPAGFLQVGDRLQFGQFMVRSGTLAAPGGAISVRLGANETPTNNAILSSSRITGATNTYRAAHFWTVVTSVTRVRRPEIGNGTGFSDSTATTVTTITNVSTTAQRLAITVTPGGVAEVVTTYNAFLTLYPGV